MAVVTCDRDKEKDIGELSTLGVSGLELRDGSPYPCIPMPVPSGTPTYRNELAQLRIAALGRIAALKGWNVGREEFEALAAAPDLQTALTILRERAKSGPPQLPAVVPPPTSSAAARFIKDLWPPRWFRRSDS